MSGHLENAEKHLKRAAAAYASMPLKSVTSSAVMPLMHAVGELITEVAELREDLKNVEADL